MNKKGFTLIELLVVVAIIGLLSTLAVVALSTAREKTRDSKRLSDLKNIQTALELHYTGSNQYPVAQVAVDLGAGDFACLNGDGFGAVGCATPFLEVVPSGPNAAEVYTYTSDDGTAFAVVATLEGELGGLSGDVTASQSGIN
ncbi:MAG: prepilin-type N-terminal cleavage/methylation domain-containing protein [Candidatus Magasanikbacteria bacterium]|jgi:prepilin-type N-terminal cleavage/methylation domain-containing protein|nr:prepilin-type N-terminal cleavage/methylation domain-containing protein [Candidatus Magasanikbacteria bacterium]MBT5262454.1 prepilin-type N-terminal cleavage/methylation domain-containing protein [Candidatus Magasanikbacteria bacterium]MBT5820449.1 prepilin-type N-terminal cleavage/methylation domain-containing protein [Candidatus Magasanikbacteria bacterium]MBT6294447.1 prepilin-type N-terminal cleavage/methylation domain-containing protein [Candidatus Magasanikbacteria bacterium]